MSVLNLSFLVGLGYFGRGVDAYSYLYGMPAVIIGLLFIPLLTTALSAVLVVVTSLSLKRGIPSLLGRAYFSLTTILALTLRLGDHLIRSVSPSPRSGS